MNLDAELALLSEAVYLPTWEAVERMIAPHWQLAVPFEIGGTEAMICRRGADYTAFITRGTQFSEGKLSDIMANFGSWSLWEGPGSIHAGYFGHMRDLYAPARDALKRMAGAPCIVGGHSLGGAGAHVYAARNACDPEGHIIDAVVTFGAPKCFNRESCGVIQVPIRRYVIEGDFAPKWPVNPWVKHPSFCEPLKRKPPTSGMSSVGRHWIGAYRTVLDREPVTA